MKKSLFLIALAMMSFASIHNANAQNDNQRNNRIAEFRARQTEQLVQDLKLTAEQKTKFEAVFKNYQEELMALRQDRPQAASNDQELTDEQATARLQEVFQRQAEQFQQWQMRLDIQKKYCSEFSAFLTPQQLLRVFAPQTGRGRNGQQQRGGRGGGFGGPGGGFGGPGGGFGGPGGGF